LRAAEVLGLESAERGMAEILERGLDELLEKRDPERQRARRLERERKRGEAAAGPRLDEVSEKEGGEASAAAAPARSRYIPAAVRERVFERAGYQCEFTASDGTRCTSRTGLEIEHEKPFAIFRDHDEQFLKAFCPRHNRWRAEQVYGAEFIREKIAEKERQRV
jgi:hypothetical protein